MERKSSIAANHKDSIMGLASALSTALTGLSAAETQVDVVGNNLANSQTAGFKASKAIFATQFLQTQSLGAAPTPGSGGVNPRQIGLGTKVAEITPDFTQGTVQVSNSPLDMAIQGDGFFIVQGQGGEPLYTRNGIFKLNSANEVVSTTGNRLMGYGIDTSYNIQRTEQVPLTIPLGSAAVAQVTQNVFLEGTLTPTGDVADTAQIIQSVTLGDASVPRPDSSAATIGVSPLPLSSGVAVNSNFNEGGGGSLTSGDVYQYRFVYVDAAGMETLSSDPLLVTVGGNATPNDSSIQLANLPAASSGYTSVNIYRTAANGNDFFRLATVPAGSTYVDTGNTALSTTPLDSSSINGNYTYIVTFARAGEQESRPSLLIGPQNVVNGRIHLDNLPVPPTPGPGDTFPAYNKVRIYRNLASDSSQYFLVDEIDPGQDYTDSKSDAAISDLNTPGNQAIDLDGPKVSSNTLLTNIIRRSGVVDSDNLFSLGSLTFEPKKGGRNLTSKEFEVTASSTLGDLLTFMNQAMGIQNSASGESNPIPPSQNNLPGATTPTISAGYTITDGQIRFTSNNGVDNALEIGLSAFTMTDNNGVVTSPNLGFGTIQEASGTSTVADFVAYDSLGIGVNVRITAVLEQKTDSATVYRWFADSGDNEPRDGTPSIAVGTGLVTFDGEGNYVSGSNVTVSIRREQGPSASPLEFDLDFSKVSGLAANRASLSAARQDGSPSGQLTSYIIGEDGVIRGVFSSGVTRDLGQILLARFSNSVGLEQRGENLFAQGVNSGLPIVANPNEQGIGTLVAGATELSNTDIGRNLIDLVLATTQYRGNSRVISTAQELLDELLNLRR
jgi:flagellar hook protein FlgE